MSAILSPLNRAIKRLAQVTEKTGKLLAQCRFKIGQTDRLEAHVGVVKIPHRWLDKENFHRDLSYNLSA